MENPFQSKIFTPIPSSNDHMFGSSSWHSPVRPDVLELYLKLTDYDTDKTNYLVSGFYYGFSIGHDGLLNNCIVENDSSISQLKDEALSKVLKEVSLKRIAGPFDAIPDEFKDDFHTSPCKIIPKKDPGSYRLLHNLSFPYDGSSINCNIDDEKKRVTYESIIDAIKKICELLPGASLAKEDILDAFRLLPKHPTEFKKLFFSIGDQIFCDLAGSMGCSSICKMFEEVSSALHHIFLNVHKLLFRFCTFPIPRSLQNSHSLLMRQQPSAVMESNGNLSHMVDDFLFINSSHRACEQDVANFHQLCQDLGIPIALHKSSRPDTSVIFLGFTLDTIAQTASLPRDKIAQYSADIKAFLECRRFPLKTCQALAGKLSFASAVVPARAFLRRLFDFIRSYEDQVQFAFLSRELKADLITWLQFLDEYNGTTFYRLSDPFVDTGIHIASDACDFGFGAIYGKKWIQGIYPVDCKNVNINCKELFPVIVMVELFGPTWANSIVRLHTDNMSTMVAVNKQTSKSASMMVLIRRLVMLLVKFNIHLRSQHVAGALNILPDLISRFRVSTTLLNEYNMDLHPTDIPQSLWPVSSTFK